MMEGRWRQALLLLPANLIVVGLFAVPLTLLFVISFWSIKGFSLRPDFTIASYLKLAVDYSAVLAFTVGLALLVAALQVRQWVPVWDNYDLKSAASRVKDF